MVAAKDDNAIARWRVICRFGCAKHQKCESCVSKLAPFKIIRAHYDEISTTVISNTPCSCQTERSLAANTPYLPRVNGCIGCYFHLKLQWVRCDLGLGFSGDCLQAERAADRGIR